MNIERMDPGDVVYGPFPAKVIKDATKMNHYCLVLSVDRDSGLFLAAIGTSNHIDSSPLPTELLVSRQEDIRKAKLKKPTRFDVSEMAWLSADVFVECGNIRFSQKLIYGFFKSCKAAGLLKEEEYD
ncbi:hypothetical protein B1757_02360 [Acidithiobacillus marinus]|uniref:PemK-like protein n=1 Tax=Acidithiobacillus marinus TaxID=187490 RepID=A0A2I1DPI2_9PROT|nr:hypothetical protein [Acidithiobacillus marinus]PKY11824.1 hypothetical protein B1757_02360 [Acidithiobacillus marinus]